MPRGLTFRDVSERFVAKRHSTATGYFAHRFVSEADLVLQEGRGGMRQCAKVIFNIGRYEHLRENADLVIAGLCAIAEDVSYVSRSRG